MAPVTGSDAGGVVPVATQADSRPPESLPVPVPEESSGGSVATMRVDYSAEHVHRGGFAMPAAQKEVELESCQLVDAAAP